jgi:16S rRNA processing protein RimM
MPEFVEIGKVYGFNAKSEVRIKLFANDSVLRDVDCFFTREHEKLRVFGKPRILGGILFLKLENPRDYFGLVVFVRKCDLKLCEHEFFADDLIGCSVFDVKSRQEYGKIFEIISGNAHDVYSIKSASGEEFLIPAVSNVVKKVDICTKCILIEPMCGMFL